MHSAYYLLISRTCGTGTGTGRSLNKLLAIIGFDRRYHVIQNFWTTWLHDIEQGIGSLHIITLVFGVIVVRVIVGFGFDVVVSVGIGVIVKWGFCYWNIG
jgi:hypothetical protein